MVPKIDIAKAMVRTKGVYPEPWRAVTEGREKAALGDVVGLTQFDDGGTTVLQPGDAAGFKAGVANGHHLVNRSQRDAVYLEVGTRAKRERAHYSDVDLVYDRDESGFRFSRK